MKDLTVIVPIHEYTEEVEKLLTNAVESYKKIADDENILMFVGPAKVLDKVKKMSVLDGNNNVVFLENKDIDFCTQINVAVDACVTKYFSILEFDDLYMPNWFKNAEAYMELDNNISVVLPLTEIVMADKIEDGPVGYVNEAVWATSFSDEIGYLDIEALLTYMNFNTTGGIFNKEDFIKIGKLKKSIKLTYWYECLLRSVYNGKKVYVVPKVGYQHFLNRKGSISDTYNNTLTPDEADFWIELAQKDYLFNKERDKSHYQFEQ